MRTYTIAPTARPSFASVASIFIAAYGTIWLFIEPLGLFGLISPIGGMTGLTSYLLMLLGALIVVAVFLRSYHWYRVHDLPFVFIQVSSASDGVTYSLRVSENMQVGDFLHKYLELLSRGPGRENVETFKRMHFPVLQVLRGNEYADVDANLTIHAAGLKNGDQCQVRGEIHPYFNQTRLSIRP